MTKFSRLFLTLITTKSVGVMGNSKTHDYTSSLRALTSVGSMTADYYKYDQKFLSDKSERIINKLSVNRVKYNIISKP